MNYRFSMAHLIVAKTKEELTGSIQVGGAGGLKYFSFSDDTSFHLFIKDGSCTLFENWGIITVKDAIHHVEHYLTHFLTEKYEYKIKKEWKDKVIKNGIKMLAFLYKYENYYVSL